MAGTYNFFTADVMTNAVIATNLPFAGVTFSKVLNHYGSFTGMLPLGSDFMQAIDFNRAVELRRAKLYVTRDGDILWSGLIFTRRWQESTQEWEIGGSELWRLAHRERVQQPIVYTNVDQLGIAQDLLCYMQGYSGNFGNNWTGVNVGSDFHWTVGFETSPANTSVAFAQNEFKTIGESVEAMAARDTGQATGTGLGFDFSVDSSLVPGRPSTVQEAVHLWYPRKGQAAATSGYVFEYPNGNMVDFSWPEDASGTANALIGLGANNGLNMLTTTLTDENQISNGYPKLMDTVSYKDTQDLALLTASVRADLAIFSKPVELPTIVVHCDVPPILGSYDTGDEVRLRIRSNRFPAGLDTYMRIVAISVQTPSAGAPELATLTLGPVLT
jgi:hypothetical protein